MRQRIMDKVEKLLRKYPELRDDDLYLFATVCYNTNKNIWYMPFGKVIKHHKELKLPSYESVTRARRKLQESIPELRGKRYTERQRAEREYRETYRRHDNAV